MKNLLLIAILLIGSSVNSLAIQGQVDIDRSLKAYSSLVREDPENYFYHLKLGEAYLRKGRQTGIAKYYQNAERAFNKSVELNPDNFSAFIYLGQVSSFKHDFDQTINHAMKAIKLKDYESAPYGILGDAYLQIGEYNKAQKAYDLMFKLKPDFYAYTRLSHLNELSGDIDGAIQNLEEAINIAINYNHPSENIAWAQVILGTMYFKNGDLTTAEKYYQKSLSTLNDYYLALEHIAEIKSLRGDYQDAEKIYKKVIESNPNPEFLIALGDVYSAMGNKRKAEELFVQAEKIYEDYLNDNFYGYIEHQIQFYIDREKKLDKALQLAKKDLELRQDIYAYDNLAWAHYKLEEYKSALEASEKSLILGTKDPSLFYHAGMINYKVENFNKAKEYLLLAKKSLDYFDSVTKLEIAKTLEIVEKSLKPM